jgi:hypothetical protein
MHKYNLPFIMIKAYFYVYIVFAIYSSDAFIYGVRPKLRRAISPKGHYFEGPLLRKVVSPNYRSYGLVETEC